MRNMSKNFKDYTDDVLNKYIILDGDIDPEWVEAMNTVMDDNKVLTLASNERIAMTQSMRMILEIEDMRNATPATASRGGCLCINEADIGWLPYLNQWKETIGKRVLKYEQIKQFKQVEEDLFNIIKIQVELCYDSQWFKDDFMEAYLFDTDVVVPIMRMAICQTVTTVLDSQFFDHKIRKKLIDLKSDDDRKNAIAMIF